MDIAAAKKQLRARAVEQRRSAFEAAGPDAGAHLAQNVIATALIGPADVVSGFWPMGEEIDLLPLLTALDARRKCLCASGHGAEERAADLPGMASGPRTAPA